MVVLILNFSLGIFVFLTKRESKVNQYFFIFSIAATLWGLSLLFFRSVGGLPNTTAFARILYASAATIPYAFLFFIRLFPEDKFNLPPRSELYLVFPFLGVLALSVFPDVLITGVVHTVGFEQTISFNIFFHALYALYILTYFSICYGLLFYKYIKFEGVQKQQVFYVIVGTLVATVVGVVTNLLLPFFGYFQFNWMGQVGIITMVGSISYSILKHKLFNLKIVATQFIVYALCVSLFIRVLLSSSTPDIIINSVFLLISIVIGVLLIRSVVNEVSQRERVEILAKDLEKANISLESANERLKSLDQSKSEFLSLATHQIRAPLTAIKGYASLILEGDYGETSPQVSNAVNIIFQSCESLVVIVNEFLDISRIEQGRMKYNIGDFDIKTVSEEIVTELKPNIEHANLSVTFKAEPGDYIVTADAGKIKQVIGNLIDNSIKYTPTGGITITVSREKNMVRCAISDTGIGVSPEDIPKLFTKFSRAKDANKTNVIGTGLGLYVAKQMMEAQHGTVSISSPGANKGTTCTIELPATHTV